MSKEATDYFGLYGYRALALAVIEQALDDLVQTRNPELKRAAMEWIELEPSRDAPRDGLTFDECVDAAGAASARETFRLRCRTDPVALKQDLRRFSTSMHCERKFERSAAGEDGEADRMMALRTQGLVPTHVLHRNEPAGHTAPQAFAG